MAQRWYATTDDVPETVLMPNMETTLTKITITITSLILAQMQISRVLHDDGDISGFRYTSTIAPEKNSQ